MGTVAPAQEAVVPVRRGLGLPPMGTVASALPPTGTVAPASTSSAQGGQAECQDVGGCEADEADEADDASMAFTPPAPPSLSTVLRMAAQRLASQGQSPLCVCGSRLQMITLQEREERFMVQAEAWRFSERLAPLYRQGCMRIVCDLCSQELKHTQVVVWVCERGDNTIKHATSNDICARCFGQHVWGVDTH